MKRVEMMNMRANVRTTLLAFGAAGLLTVAVGAGVGFVSAQTSAEDSTTDLANSALDNSAAELTPQTNARGRVKRGHGFGARFGGYGFGGLLALGTTVTYTFYDGDPAANGGVTDTLSFTFGEDSEAAFAETLSAARADASYAVVQTSEQTRTLDLNTLDLSTLNSSNLDLGAFGNEANDWRGPGLGFLRRGLSEGESISVSFYDADPQTGAESLETLAFTYGQDSEAGFAADVEAALENASFVTVTTGPQERTVDLSQQVDDDDGPGFGSWEGHGESKRGGPGRGGWGRR